jgi:hypothetical protein
VNVYFQLARSKLNEGHLEHVIDLLLMMRQMGECQQYASPVLSSACFVALGQLTGIECLQATCMNF